MAALPTYISSIINLQEVLTIPQLRQHPLLNLNQHLEILYSNGEIHRTAWTIPEEILIKYADINNILVQWSQHGNIHHFDVLSNSGVVFRPTNNMDIKRKNMVDRMSALSRSISNVPPMNAQHRNFITGYKAAADELPFCLLSAVFNKQHTKIEFEILVNPYTSNTYGKMVFRLIHQSVRILQLLDTTHAIRTYPNLKTIKIVNNNYLAEEIREVCLAMRFAETFA